MSNNDKFKELYKAIGVLAETGILFYRATIQAGATPGEARILTQYPRRRFCGNGHLQY